MCIKIVYEGGAEVIEDGETSYLKLQFVEEKIIENVSRISR